MSLFLEQAGVATITTELAVARTVRSRGTEGWKAAPPSGLNDSRSGLSEHLVEAVLGETRSGLGDELVEAALEQQRPKKAIRELPESERQRLAEAVLDQLAEDNELPEELNERLLDQMIGGMIAGKHLFKKRTCGVG